jgi:hypothetical protein
MNSVDSESDPAPGPSLEGINFEWTKEPWFLAPEHAEYLWAHRYERGELEAACAALKERYPPDFCRSYFEQLQRDGSSAGVSDAQVRTLRMRRGFAGFLFGLFQRWMMPPEILALGIDLARVMSESPDSKWLSRLRDPAGVVGTMFELEFWANCLRAGLKAKRISETKKTKTPDILLVGNGRQIALELKELATGEDEMMAFEHQPFAHLGRFRAPDDRTYRVEVAPEIRDLVHRDLTREEYRRRFGEIMNAFEDELSRLDGAGWPMGEHLVANGGRVLVTEVDPHHPPGSASVDFAADARPEQQARRVLEPLRVGAAKFREWQHPSKCAAIVVIDFPHYNVDQVHVAIRHEVEAHPATYRRTDGVVLRRNALNPDDDKSRVHEYYGCFAIRFPNGALTEGELVELARVTLDSPHRLFVPIRRVGKPDPISTIARMRLHGMTIGPAD